MAKVAAMAPCFGFSIVAYETALISRALSFLC
jgi:hypothetical protein